MVGTKNDRWKVKEEKDGPVRTAWKGMMMGSSNWKSYGVGRRLVMSRWDSQAPRSHGQRTENTHYGQIGTACSEFGKNWDGGRPRQGWKREREDGPQSHTCIRISNRWTQEPNAKSEREIHSLEIGKKFGKIRGHFVSMSMSIFGFNCQNMIESVRFLPRQNSTD